MKHSQHPDGLALVQLLETYAEALDMLGSDTQSSSPRVLRILRSRDQIQASIAAMSHLDDELWEKLADLDLELKHKSGLIHEDRRFRQLRQSFEPPESAWWWHLDPPPQTQAKSERPNWDKFDWAWNTGTVICLVLATSFMTQTAQAFSSEGFDLIGTISTISQGAGLVFVAGGALTDKGRHAVSKILNSFRIPAWLHAEVTFGASLLLLLVALGVNLNFHRVGELYFGRAQDHEEKGEFIQALDNYDRALEFAPDNLKFQIAKGFLHEKLGNFEDALDAYEQGSDFGEEAFLNAQARATLMQALKQKNWEGGVDPDVIHEIQDLFKRAGRSVVDYDDDLEDHESYNDRLANDIFINEMITKLATLQFSKIDNDDGQSILNDISAEYFKYGLYFSEENSENEEDKKFRQLTQLSTVGVVRENCFNWVLHTLASISPESNLNHGRDLDTDAIILNYACAPFFLDDRFSATPDSFLLSEIFSNPLVEKYNSAASENSVLLTNFVKFNDGNHENDHPIESALVEEPNIWKKLAAKLSEQIEQDFVVDSAFEPLEDQIIWRFLLSKDGDLINYIAYDDISRWLGENLPFATQAIQQKTVEKLSIELEAGKTLEYVDFKVVLSPEGNVQHILPWQIAYTESANMRSEADEVPFLNPDVRAAFKDYEPNLSSDSELDALRFIVMSNLEGLNDNLPWSSYYQKPISFKLTVSSDGQIVAVQFGDEYTRKKFEGKTKREKSKKAFQLYDDLEAEQFPELRTDTYQDFNLKFRHWDAYRVTPWPENEQAEKSED